MTALIWWAVGIGYVVSTLFASRFFANRFLRGAQTRWRSVDNDDRVMAAMGGLLCGVIWPLSLLWEKLLVPFLFAPFDRQEAREQRKRDSIRYWKSVQQSRDSTETEKEVASHMIEILED